MATSRRSKRKYLQLHTIEDEILVEFCARFVSGERAEVLTKWLSKRQPRLEFGRTGIYRLLEEARRRDIFRLQVPDVTACASELEKRVPNAKGRIRVVGAGGEMAAAQLASRSSEIAIELMNELRPDKIKPLTRIGLGGGRAMRSVAANLAASLRKDPAPRPLAVHALSPGFDAMRPNDAPITSLGLFDGIAQELVGLFAAPVLGPDEFERRLEIPGLAPAFKMAPKIDLVVTSLGCAKDSDAPLHRLLGVDYQGLGESRAILERAGWVGDVLYAPYSAAGPIKDELPARAVSVLSPKQLLGMAKAPNKRVLLVVGRSQSGVSKASALVPLLLEPSLRLWSDLVLDIRTAEEVLALF